MATPQEREKAVFEAIDNGNWDLALHHAKFVPPNWDIWQRLPSAAEMPNEAVHKVLDVLTKNPRHKSNLASFIYEYANNIPDHASMDLLNRLGRVHVDHNNNTPVEADLITDHPNFRHDEQAASLKRATDFWRDYEASVQPHHFATIKSMFTQKPESLTDHRGNTGNSEKYIHLLPDLHDHAQAVQEKLKNDEFLPKKQINGELHVLLHRGVGGHYGQKLQEESGYDHKTNTVQHKVFKLPTAHLTSWTTDKDMAARFAWGRGEIEGQPKDQGVVISKWVPIKHVLHSGFHPTVIGQEHEHPEENEIVVGHPDANIDVDTSDFHFQEKPDAPSIHSSSNYGNIVKPTLKKSECIVTTLDYFDDIGVSYTDIAILNKSMKKIVPAVTALALLGAPQDIKHEMPIPHLPKAVQTVTEPKPVQSLKREPAGLPPGLRAIAMIESSGGKNVKHRTMESGPHSGTRAFGKFGLMPMTITDIVSKNPALSNKYPELSDLHFKDDHDKIHEIMGSDPEIETDIAKTHWNKLMNIFGGDRSKMSYAWFNGIRGARNADPETIKSHPYVQKFHKYKQMLDLEQISKSEEIRAEVKQFIPFENIPQDQESVKDINQAIESDHLHDLSNVGQFTHDSFIAGFDPDNSWLIKLEPFGKFSRSPAMKHGLQSVREAAFYYCAQEVFGLGQFTPHAILGQIELDGERIPSVAIKMYSDSYIAAHDMEKAHPGILSAIFEKYRRQGLLHKLAAMLYILGDADAHGGNVLTNGYDIKIIDHGTSFGNISFNPSEDEYVFVPYFMRFWGYKDHESDREQFQSMPRIHDEKLLKEIKHWIMTIDIHNLKEILNNFSIDSAPVLFRLDLVQKIAKRQPVDLAINMVWTLNMGKINATVS